MKRIVIRLSALAGVIVLGLLAIAYAQRDEEPSADAGPATATVPSTEPRRLENPLDAAHVHGGEDLPSDGGRSRIEVNDRFADAQNSANSRRGDPLPADDGDRRLDRGGDLFSRRGGDLQVVDRRESDPSPAELAGQRWDTAGVGVEDRFAAPREPARLPAGDGRDEGRDTAVDDEPRFGSPLGASPPPDDQRLNQFDPPARDPRANGPTTSNPVERSVISGGPVDTGRVEIRNEPPPAEGIGRPGSKQLEGVRVPSLTLQKTAPAEIQVGRAAKFAITVRNTGKVSAEDVQVQDVVPQGTQFIDSTPKTRPGPRGELVWNLGSLPPGQADKIQIQLMPIAEGEIGSVASVTFRTEASVRTVATQPKLELQVSAPKSVMIGDEVKLTIKIANTGSGTATGVVLEQDGSAALEHPAGKGVLQYDVGNLAPGESRQLELALTASQAGQVTNTITAHDGGGIKVQDKTSLEVIAPALAVQIAGPKRRYLEHQTTYTVAVSNPGTAAAKDVELVTRLPKGMKFIQADHAGAYDKATHSVYWSLEELPAREVGQVKLTALPVATGEQKLRVDSKARQGLVASYEQTTKVEGLAAISFQVIDAQDPIQIGEETTYEISIINQGSKAATGVLIEAILPPGLAFVRADGPTRGGSSGQRVGFASLPRLAPKADTTYRVTVKGTAAGNQRIHVALKTDDMATPVKKEESTRVYSDE